MAKGPILAVILLFSAAPRALAVDPAYVKEQERFLTLLAKVNDDPDTPALREELIRFANNMAAKPKIPTEAKKQFIRAMAVHLDAVNDSDFDKAARMYWEAIKIAPWWTQCYFNRANALESAHRYEEAAEDKKFYMAARAGKPKPEELAPSKKHGTADYRGNWGGGLDCWRYEFEIRGDDLTIAMHCWDFPRTIYGTGKVNGRSFQGSSPGGMSGTGVGTRSPIRFRGSLSEDNSEVTISSILAPELAETEGAMNAAQEQVRLFGTPAWQTQTWRHMARD
jgi:tetratricopeptide (TPR) repeat protein